MTNCEVCGAPLDTGGRCTGQFHVPASAPPREPPPTTERFREIAALEAQHGASVGMPPGAVLVAAPREPSGERRSYVMAMSIHPDADHEDFLALHRLVKRLYAALSQPAAPAPTPSKEKAE